MWIAIQLSIILLGPWAILAGLRQVKFAEWLSPVVLAYLLGILIITFPIIPLDAQVSETASEASILLAIPLLLFSANIRQWFSHARNTVLSFGLCILAGTISSLFYAVLLKASIPEVSTLASMLVGVYTGGTPNMQAIGLALEAPEETFILLNAADLLWSGIYLIFLTSVGSRLLAKFLPAYQFGQQSLETPIQEATFPWSSFFKSIGICHLNRSK